MFAYILAPSTFNLARHPIRVDTSGGISRGKTWAAVTARLPVEWQDRPLVGIAVTAVSETAVADMIVAAFESDAEKSRVV